jgi:hypothetical protein
VPEPEPEPERLPDFTGFDVGTFVLAFDAVGAGTGAVAFAAGLVDGGPPAAVS